MVVESLCDEESTDFRAVTSAATEHKSFEMVDVVECIPVTKHPIQTDGISLSDETTETKYLLLFLKSIDDKITTVVIDVRFLLYDNQHRKLKEIYENGYCWFADVGNIPKINNNSLAPDFDCIIVPTKQDITQVLENTNKVNPSFFSAMTDIPNLIHLFTFGKYSHMSRDRTQQAILSYTRDVAFDISKYSPNTTVIENICNMTFNDQRYTNGLITNVADLHTFFVQIGPKEYQFTFDGRPETETHTPTQLYKSVGVGTVANLEGEEIHIAPNVHGSLYSEKFVGTNKAETFKFKSAN